MIPTTGARPPSVAQYTTQYVGPLVAGAAPTTRPMIRMSAANPTATAAVPVQGSNSMQCSGCAVYAPGPASRQVQAPSIAVSASPAAKVITISAAAEAQQAAETVTAGPGDHAFVTNQLQQKDILVLFSKSYCPFVKQAKEILSNLRPKPAMHVIELDQMGQPRHGPIQQVLRMRYGSSTVPQAFVNGTLIGGCQEISNLQGRGDLLPLLQKLGCRFVA
mmetsp:Transcript_52753/g.109901  ORF Transcript_52753/g.109901 Transcript_52753/m.109901 type:complete len:219 (+) Transcript_52753:22-678(+)